MKIYIGADHRGFKLKEEIKKYFYEHGIEYEDLGAYELDPADDYPIYAERVSHKVWQGLKEAQDPKGILICGSGVGVDIVANKFEGIRSGLGMNVGQVKSARRDDDINILAIPSDFVDKEGAIQMAEAFLNTEFDNLERHARRINEIEEIEEEK